MDPFGKGIFLISRSSEKYNVQSNTEKEFRVIGLYEGGSLAFDDMSESNQTAIDSFSKRRRPNYLDVYSLSQSDIDSPKKR